MLDELKTKRYGIPYIKSKDDAKRFFVTARSIETLDRMTENVLRINGIDVNMRTWDVALNEAQDKKLGPVVEAFIKQAILRTDILSPASVIENN